MNKPLLRTFKNRFFDIQCQFRQLHQFLNPRLRWINSGLKILSALKTQGFRASLLFLCFTGVSILAQAQNRFPKPDFESGYQYPQLIYGVPNEPLWITIDIIVLILLMSFTAWSVIRKRVRTPVVAVSLISIIYFGFFREGCVCSIGSIQNVAVALTDSSYAIPLSVLLFFILPVIFTLLFGRVFCAGVCPFGALQELVNVKNYKIPGAIASVLGIIPWIYLSLATLFAVTRSAFIICRFDPFIGIFRFGGDAPLIISGAILLIISIFTGRPFCRFICPYGALLSLFSRVSIWNVKIIKTQCINCELCHNACHVDAIRPPYDNKVKENRMRGVKRILIYLTILPLMAVAGALSMRIISDSLSGVNKKVRLYELISENEKHPQEKQILELEAFYGQGGKVDELAVQVEKIKREFKLYASVAGAFMGVIIGFTLISLSVKRTRKYYEINDSACVSCARCFSYCPQNIVNHKS
jgi:polyferredoxin